MRPISASASLVSWAALWASTAFAQPVDPARFDDAGHYVNSLYSLAKGRFARIDVDGDGLDDLVLDGVSGWGRSYLLVVGRTEDGSIQIKQTLRMADESSPLNRVLAFSHEGQPRIMTVAESGVCRVYAGWPLAQINRFDVSPNVGSAAVGDLDGDGIPELLVGSASMLGFYTVDGQLRDTLPFLQPTDIALTQLDADPALEIVLNTGTVLDGATHATEWQYVEGFGLQVATGKVVPDGSTGWVGTIPANHFTVFRAGPWSPLWSVPLPQWGRALAVLPIDDSGRDGVAVAGYWGGVQVYDLRLNQLRYQIRQGLPYALALAGLDIDGDALPDLAIGADGGQYPSGALTLHDARNGATKWEYVPTNGPHQAMIWGDTNRDGKDELTVTGTDSNQSYWLTIAYDAESGLPLWHAPFANSSNVPAVPRQGRHIALSADRDTGNQRIVLAGSDFQDAQITILDGATRDILMALRGPAIEELRARSIEGLIVSDVDADGIQDIVVATQPTNGSADGSQLLVFSGHDATLLRRTDLPSTAVQGVLLVPGDEGNPSSDRIIVSTPTQLLAYDLQTGAPTWSLDVAHRHVVHARRGLAGAEIVTISLSGEIHAFDATTRQPLRQLSFGEPIRQAAVLNDDVHAMVLALERRLVVLDGGTGAVRASSSDIGPIPPNTHSLAVSASASGTWRAAISSYEGVFRFRIRLTDALFKGTFDSD